MSSRSQLRPTAALLGIFLALAAPASADTDGAKDPKDDRPFDIVHVQHAHGHDREDEGQRLQHTIRFRKRFTGPEFKGSGGAGIHLVQQDEYVSIFRKDGRWRSRYYNKEAKVVGHPVVWRPNGRTLRVSFPRRWIEPGVDSYRWRARSLWFPPCPQPEDGPPVACTPPPPDEAKVLHHVLRS